MSAWEPFVLGGLSAMAGAGSAHPLDVIKVRMQIEAKSVSMSQTALKVFREGTMFAGLSATLARQAVYSSTRFGVYDLLKRGKKQQSMIEKVSFGLIAGGFGAVIANPFDMTLVRMQADAKLPLDQRRNYSNVFSGVIQIGKTEGISALWRGSSPTCARAMVVTASQLAVYDQAKEVLLQRFHFQDRFPAHLAAALTAGFVASVTSNPFDIVKTRVYNAPPGMFKSPIDCLQKTISEKGLMGLYTGFVPTFVRQAPYVVVMFATNEQLKVLFQRLRAKK